MVLHQPLLSLDWNLLFSAITVLVLFLVLKHFFFEKVRNFMLAREKAVEDQLKDADEASKNAQAALEKCEKRLEGAENEGNDIIKEARDRAKVQAEKILDEAKSEAEGIVEQSHKDMEKERQQAYRQMKGEINTLAIAAASKIIEKELNPEDHKEIVDKILEEAEAKPWS